MQLPEFIYLRHMLDKQGLIPVPIRFASTLVSNAASITRTGYNNDSSEYDALITHVTILAENLSNAIPLHVEIMLTDPDFGTLQTPIWRASNQDQAAASYYLSGAPALGVIVRPGGSIAGRVLFAVAHASNSLNIAGVGYLIPRMVL